MRMPIVMVLVVVLSLSTLSCLDNIGAPPSAVHGTIDGNGQYFEFTVDTRYVLDEAFGVRDTSSLVLKSLFQKAAGWELKVEAHKPKQNYIWLKINPSLKEGAYLLSVTSNCIVVESSSGEGLVRAQEDLAQLLSNRVEEEEEMTWKVPVMEVKEGYTKI